MPDDLRKMFGGPGVMIGRYIGLCDGIAAITLAHDPDARVFPALTTIALCEEDIGAELAVTFDASQPGRTIILGRIIHPFDAPASETEMRPEVLDFSAQKEITLRCGKASITLTREGKILLRGTYISSRSSGMNRIKGGSVQLN